MKQKVLFLLISATLLFVACIKLSSDDIDVEKCVSFAEKQLKLSIYNSDKRDDVIIPITLKEDSTIYYADFRDWRSGFYSGSLWYMYELSEDDNFKQAAYKYMQAVLPAKDVNTHHDIGFIINCSFGNAYRILNDSMSARIIVQAAKTLKTRYRSIVGGIQSWNTDKGRIGQMGWECPVIIDNMMNLELLFNAFAITGDSTFYNIAVSHADKTLENHFRKDASCYHVVDYNLADGSVKQKQTYQGYNDYSIWSRGQAWAIYGYSMCYRETGDERYLKQALNTFEMMRNHPKMPTDLIPYWDMSTPSIPDELRDASSAACMASALYELSTFPISESTLCKSYADKIMKALVSDDYLANIGENGFFLLKHSVGNYPRDSEVNVPFNYADYYFLEALHRKIKIEKQ